jgi:predicted esterase
VAVLQQVLHSFILLIITAWFDIKSISPYSITVDDPVGVEEVRFKNLLQFDCQTTREIHDLLAEESRKVGSEKVFVGGFSEGGTAAIFSG